MSRPDTQLIGMRGEYAVAAEIVRRGYMAAMATKNAAGVDLFVTDAGCQNTCTIQVKTTTNQRFWNVGKVLRSDTHIYIFVWFEDSEKREDHFYIVPSRVVEDIRRTSPDPRKTQPWVNRKDALNYEDAWEGLFEKMRP